MKEILYLIVIALLVRSWPMTNASNTKKCPLTKCPPFEEYASNLPHETDCTKFYKCNWGIPVLMDCPLMTPGDKYKRLHYNRRLQVCDWPWQAGCESCTKRIEGDKCPADKISNPEDDCDTYYECKDDGSKSKPKSCPEGTCFSRTCQDCVKDRAGGKCDESCDKPSEDCEDGERIPHECSCYLYLECKNKDWIRKECCGGQKFNPDTKKCDSADKVKCKDYRKSLQ